METPEDREATRERLQRIMEEKQPYTAHFQIYRPDGERRHMEAYVEPMLNGEGEVYKLRGTVQDITQRRRAEEEVEKQLQRFVFLNEMGQTVVSTLDLTRVLNRALEALRPLLNAEGVFVLLGEEEEEMRFAAADHARYESDLTHLRLPLDRSVAGIAVRTGEPQWLTDDKDDSRFFEQITEVTGYPTRSLITIPLKIQNRVIGVLEAVHSRPDAFVEDDVLTLTAAASWIAIAIENAHLYSEVERNKRRYRALAEDIVWAQEEERRRISRELHDDVGQGMIALSLQLELLGRQVEDEGLQDDLQGVKELMGSIIQRLRILSYNLRPPELDTIGLHAALSDLCRTYQKRLNLPVRFEGEELPTGVSDAIVLSFYRFLQEALTNVIKHASATQVEVKLSYNGETIRLYVTDNGRGFTPSAKNLNDGSGLGLLGMKERFTSLNGNIQITSRRGQGTEIEAFIPW